MKSFYSYFWIFSLVQVLSFSYISCFNVPKLSLVRNAPHFWAGGSICVATVFLWSFTLGCTSNSHRIPELVYAAQKTQASENHHNHRRHKSKRSKFNEDGKKKDRQGAEEDGIPDKSNEDIIMDDLREHLISKLGVLDPMMCLPKALCGLSSASTTNPNSSSELVNNYLHHMKAVMLPTTTTTTTPTSLLSPQSEINSTNVDDLKLTNEGPEDENFDDEESESEEEEDEEEEANTSEEVEEEEEVQETDREKYKKQLLKEIASHKYEEYKKEIYDEEDTPTESDELLLRDYLTDKAEVDQYKDEEDFEDVPSWWDNVPNKIQHSPISMTSALSSYAPTKMTSWFTSVLPSFSWDFGAEKRKQGIFEKDPFFTSFRSGGRSLSDVSNDDQKTQIPSDFEIKLKRRRMILNQYRKLKQKIMLEKARKGKEIGVNKSPTKTFDEIVSKIKRTSKSRKGNLTKITLRKRTNQDELLEGVSTDISEIENPITRLKTAVEIGKKLNDPRKCDVLFSACPWKYDEVLEIIDDSHKSVKNSGEFTEIKKKVKVKVKKVVPKEKIVTPLPVGVTGGSALEKLKETLKAKINNSFVRTKETVVKHELPGGAHLEVKLSHPENNKANTKPNNQFKVKKPHPEILKPFLEAQVLGTKIKKRKKNEKKNIEYKYPKYNYRVSFPNTDHKDIIIKQYQEMTTHKPIKIRESTKASVSSAKKPKKGKTKAKPAQEIDVEDSGENIIIRIPKDKNQGSAGYNTRNPLLFNPFRIYSSPYATLPTPTLIPAPAPQYYNQYYQYQYQQPQQQFQQPQLQPSPWYYLNSNKNNYPYKRAW